MSYEKVLEQIEHKKGKRKKFEKNNAPKERDYGKAKKECRRCGRTGRGIVGQYGLDYCRQCFREIAEEVGFKQLK